MNPPFVEQAKEASSMGMIRTAGTGSPTRLCTAALWLVLAMPMAATGQAQRLTDEVAVDPARASFVYTDIEHFL